MNNLRTPQVREKMTLTDWLRANTRWLIDPIVTFLARFRLSPDLLTVAGMLTHIFFAWLIANNHLFWAGIAIFFIAPLDALDGALARKLGRKQGGFGAFLDSTLDRIAEIILFAGFIFYFMSQQAPLWVMLGYAALTGAMMVSYTRSRAEGLGIPCKVGLFSRVERYGVIIIFLILQRPDLGIAFLALGTWVTAIQRIVHVWKQFQA